ncbi:MAG: hypothetical protein ACR2GQ_11340 [Gemmatimonadota bacterium]
MVVDEDDAKAGITGWVTLTNQSGATYENATLKLVAGDVQRVSGDYDRLRMAAKPQAEFRDAEDGFSEEAFFEYHLYTLGRPATIKQN